MSEPVDYLTPILERKRAEIVRRRRHQLLHTPATHADPSRARLAVAALRRSPGQPPRVIAEIKRRSPSAGVLRPREPGDIEWLAQQYERGGAAAISVLCDGPGFAGSPLDLRRATRVASVPLLFKEFVLDESQIALASAVGAHMVLLIVRALTPERLQQLCAATLAAGMAPVVEAASQPEVVAALRTDATIIGVNARDLRTFRVDPQAAQHALLSIPAERVAVHMSGVHAAADFQLVAQGRADAMLVGESLMRARSPASKLAELCGA
jgi:indole-3-glycerol phosphate synthase